MNPIEIRNTPGYFYAVAYWLAALLVIMGPRWKKISGIPRKLLFWGVLIFLLIFMTITKNAEDGVFVLSMIINTFAILLEIRVCWKKTWTQALYLTAESMMAGEFMASLSWQICYYFGLNILGEIPVLLQSVSMLLTYSLIMALGWLFKKRFLGELTESAITLRDALVISISVLAIYIVSNLSYIIGDSLFSSSGFWETFLIRTLVDASGVAIVMAYRFQAREMQLRLERDAMRSIAETQYKTYQLSKDTIDMVNQKYHDLKHQIVLLKEETGSSKRLEYLNQMEQEIRIYEAQNKTGNKVLDTVLTVKSTYCQNRGIELKIIADGKLLGFMSDMEISSLFGNMLDNAIEYVEKQPDPRKRLIRLYISQEKGFLRISMENYCEDLMKFRNGMPITTKNDHYLHGYGMKSIKKIVTKYDGSVVCAQENNWFLLRILIPLRQERADT